MMMKYLVAGGTFALALAINHAAPAASTTESTVPWPAPASSALGSSDVALKTFVLASCPELASVAAAPRDDGSDSGDDGGDDGGDGGE